MKKILAIDGGGIRGIIPALVLAEVEKKTGRHITELFDLIAGTSTGGIIALAISAQGSNAGKPRYSARETAELYIKHGKEIFDRNLLKEITSIGGLIDEKYMQDGIKSVMQNALPSDPIIGDSLNKILISTYDIERREPRFFKSWSPKWSGIKVVDAALATSAAPTYFEPHHFNYNGEEYSLVDGGVFANNPSVSAYSEAMRLWNDSKIVVCSLGTGVHKAPIPYEKAKDWGQAQWSRRILAMVFSGVSDAANYQMNQILGDDFIRIPGELIDSSEELDNVSEKNIDALISDADATIHRYSDVIEKICELVSLD